MFGFLETRASARDRVRSIDSMVMDPGENLGTVPTHYRGGNSAPEPSSSLEPFTPMDAPTIAHTKEYQEGEQAGLKTFMDARLGEFTDWLGSRDDEEERDAVKFAVLDNSSKKPFPDSAREPSLQSLRDMAKITPDVKIENALAVGVWSDPLADGDCGICMQDLMDLCGMCTDDAGTAFECVVVTGTCGHSYHKHCLREWNSERCPLCTRNFSIASETKPLPQLVTAEDEAADNEFLQSING